MPPATALHPGTNAPSSVSRVLILGYYDGATDGVLQLGDGGPVFRFDWTDEVHNPDGCDTRSFALRRLPDDALDRLVGILAEHHEPKWPTWAPIWQFPTPEVQADVTARVDAVVDSAGAAEWTITTSDTVAFRRFEATPARAPAGRFGK